MDLDTKIVDWLSSYAKNNSVIFVVGVSGGVDSALVSTLCGLTGIETHVVNISINQKQDQIEMANKHISWLNSNFKNIKSYNIDISETFSVFKTQLNGFNSDLGWANTKSRLRMVTLYQIASFVNGIVVGTGNKIEDFGIGFFTKYGDGGVDISPIADLTKSEVRQMAKKLGVLDEIVTQKPTDGLWDDGRNDEDQIGATYDELEWAMDYLDNKLKHDLTDRQLKVMDIYLNFNKKNKHKMTQIPIFKK